MYDKVILSHVTPIPATERWLNDVARASSHDNGDTARKIVRRITKYLRRAKCESEDATCSRLHVGVVLVKDDAVISAGYNGAPKGFAHCDHSRCTTHDLPWGNCGVSTANYIDKLTGGVVTQATAAPRSECVQSDTRAGHCQNVVHADLNCLIRCKTDAVGSEMFLTHAPCWECFKAIVNAGVKVVVYEKDYRTDDRIFQGAGNAGIVLLGPQQIEIIKKMAESNER